MHNIKLMEASFSGYAELKRVLEKIFYIKPVIGSCNNSTSKKKMQVHWKGCEVDSYYSSESCARYYIFSLHQMAKRIEWDCKKQ